MSKQAATVIGLVIGVGCVGLLAYWLSHGDLVTVGFVVVGIFVGGAYTLTRPGRSVFPPATADAPSPLTGPAPTGGDIGSVGAVPASRSVIRLGSLLATEKGYEPVEPPEPSFGYIGRTRHKGSYAWFALVDADELDEATTLRFAERFFDLVWNDGSLRVLSAYGILCFVFDDTPSPRMVEYIRGLKRHPAQMAWMVYWSIDLVSGRVISHGGSPWGLYPGRAYLEKAIRS